jgi:predicted kinase
VSESAVGERDAPSVFLITGISAAGKSTVAQLLAERFPRAVHVRGDAFRRAVVTGREEMSADPSDEALSQLLLRYELMAITVDKYAAHGFTVVAQDVILGPLLETVVAMIATRPLGLVVLAPSPATVGERERGRVKDGYHTFTPEQLDASLRGETPPLGLWVDSSPQTPDQTVNEILERIDPDGLIWT